MSSVRIDWGCLCGVAPVVSASSKTDPLLVKADPISKAGDASVKTCLRKGKKRFTAAVSEE